MLPSPNGLQVPTVDLQYCASECSSLNSKPYVQSSEQRQALSMRTKEKGRVITYCLSVADWKSSVFLCTDIKDTFLLINYMVLVI